MATDAERKLEKQTILLRETADRLAGISRLANYTFDRQTADNAKRAEATSKIVHFRKFDQRDTTVAYNFVTEKIPTALLKDDSALARGLRQVHQSADSWPEQPDFGRVELNHQKRVV